jgi:hypothetical protein
MSIETVLGNTEFEIVVFGVTFAVVTKRSASGHDNQYLVSVDRDITYSCMYLYVFFIRIKMIN